jgi:hypothetical protein
VKLHVTTLVADDVLRHPQPLIIPKDRTVQSSQGCLQKTALDLICSKLGIPRVHATWGECNLYQRGHFTRCEGS